MTIVAIQEEGGSIVLRIHAGKRVSSSSEVKLWNTVRNQYIDIYRYHYYCTPGR